VDLCRGNPYDTGPGFANVDASLAKGWKPRLLGESGGIDYRFEAFNLLTEPSR
jgi:hypothetical protein